MAQKKKKRKARLKVTAPATERTTTRYPRDITISGPGGENPVHIKAGTVTSRPDYPALRRKKIHGRRSLRRKPSRRSLSSRR